MPIVFRKTVEDGTSCRRAPPVIGHIHLLKQPLPRTLERFSKTSGPIFSLKLGVQRCVVVSAPDLVEECFTKHDIVLANWPHSLADEYIAYNQHSLMGAPYGDYWRSLCRISAQELFSTARLNNFLSIRKEEIDRLLLSLRQVSNQGFSMVELRSKLSELTFNIMTRMVAGKRYSIKDKNEKGRNFLEVVREKLVYLSKEMDVFFQGLVDEHRAEKRNTMIGSLLSLQESQPQFYSDVAIKGQALGMILAGADTSSVTIEWAMSLLLNHPRVLQTARAELETKVGHHRLINEDDLPNLPYLRNIILETFRLFPSVPLLLPHMPSEDCRVGEYDVTRNPEVWEDPMSYKPESFEGKEAEPHKLIPFGMGRRVCPGSGLAQRMVGEGIGLAMPKLEPLEAMCKPREIMNNIFEKQA
ncbi:hypothetical protein ACS0TY_029348 [Phlomoides rotata]